MVKVEVKWNKQVFGDVELDLAKDVPTFKSQLRALTGVPHDRQKLMAKGAWKGILKDDADLSSLSVPEGQIITLMGSAEVVEKPQEKVVFIEDMKEEDLAATDAVLPAGLVNQGNTCYSNSTLQCLRKVPELRHTLENSALDPGLAYSMLTVAFRDTLNALDRSTSPYAPSIFLTSLRNMYPQFDERGQRGMHMQQDAEELYSSLLSALAQTLKRTVPLSFRDGDDALYVAADGTRKPAKIVRVHHDDPSAPYFTIRILPPKSKDPSSLKRKQAAAAALSPPPAAVEGEEKQTDISRLEKPGGSLKDLGGADNVIDALFGIEMEQELTCQECPDEPKVTKLDRQRKLVCNIQGGAGAATQIGHMSEGIKLGLVGEVEKHSDLLGRNAVWTKTSRIKKLPRYICVQFMRFFWKATPNSQDHAGVKCKIMRPITFPNVLDVYEFCSDELKAILDKPRSLVDDDILGKNKRNANGEKKSGEEQAGGVTTGEEENSGGGDAQMEVEDDEEAAALQAAIAMSMDENASLEDVIMKEGAAGPGLPGSFKGNYEVFAVVTHKGREADGGHYMGWVRQEGDDWLVFDDADVSPCKTEDIMNLKGGGDWHMAYLTFWRFKD